METIEKIIHALLYGEKLFYSSFDAKECEHCTSPKKSSYSFSYYTNTLWRRAEDCAVIVFGLNGSCVVCKVERRKIQVVEGTLKNL